MFLLIIQLGDHPCSICAQDDRCVRLAILAQVGLITRLLVPSFCPTRPVPCGNRRAGRYPHSPALSVVSVLLLLQF